MTQYLWPPRIKDTGCPGSVRIGILRGVTAVPDQARKVAMYF
jgi:hypothetical protein